MILNTLYWSNITIKGTGYSKEYKYAIIEFDNNMLSVFPCNSDGSRFRSSLVYGNPVVEKLTPYKLRICAKYFSEDVSGECIDEPKDIILPVTLRAEF